MDLNAAKIFVRVVQKGSFSSASKSLKIPSSTVSRKVAELEGSLNIRLLERSTRRLRLTESGMIFYDFASKGLQEMDAGFLALQEQQHLLQGKLRLSMPPNFELMWPVLHAFQKSYPSIDIHLLSSTHKLDLIENSIDVAIRVGDVKSLSVVARALTQFRHVVVASPAYIERYGEPQTPQELMHYQCSAWGYSEQDPQWKFVHGPVTISPKWIGNDYRYLKSLALQNEYIVELPPFFCKEEIANKELVSLLCDYPMEKQIVNIVYPSRKLLSRIARTFIDYSVAYFSNIKT